MIVTLMNENYPKFPSVSSLPDEPQHHVDFFANNPGAVIWLQHPVEVECGRFEFYSITLSNYSS
jgi:hypothetical protein